MQENRYYCKCCGHEFNFNIDGCPECGSQLIEDLYDRDV